MLFPHSYEAEVLDEFTPTTDISRFYFPGASDQGGRDGVAVRVTAANGREWLGIFEFGNQPGILLSGIFSCPDEDLLCVVSGGRGYFVCSDNPTQWSEVPVTPVTNVLQVLEAGLLIFSDFTSLCAWGARGLAWQSKQLAWDDLVISSCDGRTLRGNGFNPIESSIVSFSVDVVTGKHQGGSSPDQYDRVVTRGPR
jgi:hypothetical protein